ncbi:response regulator [Candidatus Nomurabacteria bacterium]|nr:response regulator [Candidatus Nomurabacteria bacterium]
MDQVRVLIVEDDDFLSQMYAAKLELEDFNVLTAMTGTAGLKLAQKELPDFILLDLNLPEMDGFEVLRNLKADEKTKNIPVLILTNFSQKEHIDKCLDLGAEDYLIKAHFVPSEVVAKIKGILSK